MVDFNYRTFREIAKQFGSVVTAPEAISLERAAAEIADDSPVAKALNLIAEEAVKSRASDIHIEPEMDRLRVRYRIDGILHEVTSLPIGAHAPLISRIKILAGINIAAPHRPQDGQFSFKTKDREVDIRVTTISTVHGEMAVLRLNEEVKPTEIMEYDGVVKMPPRRRYVLQLEIRRVRKAQPKVTEP